MKKKLFVVLEQGNGINNLLSEKNKKCFTTQYSDHFRLNWKADRRDKLADFYLEKITWSEGRSYMFDKVKGKYKYYVFIDDDIDFFSKTNNNVAKELKLFFEKYNPLTGTIYSHDWSCSNHEHKITEDRKEVFNIMAHDLCCHYFQEDFANFMFPVIYHGSGRSMWYSQFIAYKLFPQKCISLNNVNVKNTCHDPHHDHKLNHYINEKKLVELFSKLFLKNDDQKEFLKWNDPLYIKMMNKEIYKNSCNKEKVIFDKNILSTILNLNVTDYKNRQIIVHNIIS